MQMTYSFKKIDKQNNQLVIDSSGINDGYFFAAVAHPTNKKLKLRIIKDKDTQTYDFKNNGNFEMFSLQFGDGCYQITLYENIYSNKYSAAGIIYLNVKLKNKNCGFLVPNQYINYYQIPELITLTKQICIAQNKNENLKIIKSYIKKNFSYDFIKAIKIQKGILPDIKGTIEKRLGICFDLASLAVAMFRIAGIPAKLVIGMADKQYHAWVEIIGENKSILYDPTQEINGIGKIKEYIPERYY